MLKIQDEKVLLREWLSRIPEDFIADHQVPDDINTIKVTVQNYSTDICRVTSDLIQMKR